MIGFYLKKNFCDGWDNMFQLLIVNLVVLLCGIAAFFAISAVGAANTGVAMLLTILFSGIGMIFVFAYGESAAAIANFESLSLKDYFRAIPGSARDGFFFGVLTGVILTSGIVGIPGYISMKNPAGLLFGIILFWLEIFAVLILQWFLPVRSLMHNNFGKCLKKSFILFFDNTGFSVFLALYTFVLLLLSVFLFFLLPSVTGVVLADVNALKLRMYKYDWLEKHPELKTRKEQKDVPWEELVQNDRDILGPRKFKSFIFPWKD
jgi:hypothetical protein